MSPKLAAGPSIMAEVKVRPMRRPGYGRVGQKVRLEANFFKLDVNLTEIYQYSVEIVAMRRPARGAGSSSSGAGAPAPMDIAPTAFIDFNRGAFALACQTYPRRLPYPLAYDGRKTAYAARELPSSTAGYKCKVTVNRDGGAPNADEVSNRQTEDITVVMRPAATIDLRSILRKGPVDSGVASAGLSAIDVVLACGPLTTHVPVGRSFYHQSGAVPLGQGAEAWRGFYQSARLSESGLLINMDESRTPFWQKGGRPLSDLIADLNNNRMISTRDTAILKSLGKQLSLLKVKATHSKITYRVHGFSKQSATEILFFDQSANKNVSVVDYFRNHYNIRLRQPHLPCIKTNPKRETYVPIEVLTVSEKQRLTRAMTPDQTAAMIRAAATKPVNRRNGALNALQRINHRSDRTCREFKVDVTPRMLTVNARILPAPIVEYSGGKTARPSAGAWNPRHQEKLSSGSPLKTWAIVNTTRTPERDIRTFAKELLSKAVQMGITTDPSSVPKIFNVREDQLERDLPRVKREYDDPKMRVDKFPLQLILVIKFKQEAHSYNTIKRVCDLDLGVATQVMLSKFISSRTNETYYGNLLLKINMKLGGMNGIVRPYAANRIPVPDVDFIKRPHIVLGADVTHPAGGGNRPSVAALVGSRDRHMGQFTGAIRNQPSRQEIMHEMGDMFLEVYRRWFENFERKFHAEAIIMFRDGVSEGQFEQVMQAELASLRRACSTVKSTWNPRITYIIVTKRHHARFFPGQGQGDRSGNIMPGTVIDTDIVSSQYYDFYLNTHSGIQGTSRPSKYTVLLDENKIDVDALQGYIFRLAHSYARCNRSVSMVNSACYAHLLAFRGRAYLGDDDSDTASMASDPSAAPPPTRNLHSILSRRLFFC